MTLFEKLAPVFKVDGEDHIRISVRGETLIGRMASHDYKYEFFIPHLGHFLSPVCFANWLATGEEDARHNPEFKLRANVQGYRKHILYAKYWQLCKMRPRLVKEKFDLPFVSYRVHQTGIKELNRWREYAPSVKLMVEHIFDPKRGSSAPYKWPTGLVAEVDNLIAKIAERQGHTSKPDPVEVKETLTENVNTDNQPE